MNRIVLGAVAALLLASAGLFWWQGRAATETGAPPPALAARAAGPAGLPSGDARGLRGPALPEVDDVSREQRRFDRLDRDRDARITRNEMLVPRVPAFRKLDTDGNNLLTFEEWAAQTSSRFRGADANGDGALTRPEFVATRPKRQAQPDCRCAPARPQAGRRPAPQRQADPAAEDDMEDVSGGEGDEPAF